MKKQTAIAFTIIAVVLAGGCLTKTDKEIDEAYIEDDILHLKFELWDVGYSPIPDVYFSGTLNIWLNGKKFDVDWKKYPDELTKNYNLSIIYRGRFWGLNSYKGEALYSAGQVTTSGSSDRSSWQRAQIVYLDILLENTTLKPPITIELKEKKKLLGYEYYKTHDKKMAEVKPG